MESEAEVDERLSMKPIPAVIPATYSTVVMEVFVISLMTLRWVTLSVSKEPVVPLKTETVASGVLNTPTKPWDAVRPVATRSCAVRLTIEAVVPVIAWTASRETDAVRDVRTPTEDRSETIS